MGGGPIISYSFSVGACQKAILQKGNFQIETIGAPLRGVSTHLTEVSVFISDFHKMQKASETWRFACFLSFLGAFNLRQFLTLVKMEGMLPKLPFEAAKGQLRAAQRGLKRRPKGCFHFVKRKPSPDLPRRGRSQGLRKLRYGPPIMGELKEAPMARALGAYGIPAVGTSNGQRRVEPIPPCLRQECRRLLQ